MAGAVVTVIGVGDEVVFGWVFCLYVLFIRVIGGWLRFLGF